jgi:hypothetical protein
VTLSSPRLAYNKHLSQINCLLLLADVAVDDVDDVGPTQSASKQSTPRAR